MMVRQDFAPHLPPREFLNQIMDTVTSLYCFLWDKKDEHNRIQMTWNDVSKYYNKNSFRTNIRKLNTKGLLDYEENKHAIQIELVGWDEVVELNEN